MRKKGSYSSNRAGLSLHANSRSKAYCEGRKLGAEEKTRQFEELKKAGATVHYCWFHTRDQAVCGASYSVVVVYSENVHEVTCERCLVAMDEFTEAGVAVYNKHGFIDLTKNVVVGEDIMYLCRDCMTGVAKYPRALCKDCVTLHKEVYELPKSMHTLFYGEE